MKEVDFSHLSPMKGLVFLLFLSLIGFNNAQDYCPSEATGCQGCSTKWDYNNITSVVYIQTNGKCTAVFTWPFEYQSDDSNPWLKFLCEYSNTGETCNTRHDTTCASCLTYTITDLDVLDDPYVIFYDSCNNFFDISLTQPCVNAADGTTKIPITNPVSTTLGTQTSSPPITTTKHPITSPVSTTITTQTTRFSTITEVPTDKTHLPITTNTPSATTIFPTTTKIIKTTTKEAETTQSSILTTLDTQTSSPPITTTKNPTTNSVPTTLTSQTTTPSTTTEVRTYTSRLPITTNTPTVTQTSSPPITNTKIPTTNPVPTTVTIASTTTHLPITTNAPTVTSNFSTTTKIIKTTTKESETTQPEISTTQEQRTTIGPITKTSTPLVVTTQETRTPRFPTDGVTTVTSSSSFTGTSIPYCPEYHECNSCPINYEIPSFTQYAEVHGNGECTVTFTWEYPYQEDIRMEFLCYYIDGEHCHKEEPYVCGSCESFTLHNVKNYEEPILEYLDSCGNRKPIILTRDCY